MVATTSLRSGLALLRSPVGYVAGLGVLVIGLAVVAGPLLLGDSARLVSPGDALQPPSLGHPFGTDELGRDLFSRVVVATRLSLGLSVLATLTGAVIGVVIGTLPVVTGPRLGRLFAHGINMSLAFPALLLALFTATVVGTGARGAVVAISLAMAPVFGRLTQTLAAGVKHSEYILAARMLGAGPVALVLRHVLPNIAAPLLVTFMIAISGALVVLSGMSFLGLGIQAPAYDWGSLLNNGLPRIYTNPAYALGPCLAVILGGLVFSILGDAAALVLGLRKPPGGRRGGQAGESTASQTAPESGMPPGDLVSVRGLRVTIPLPEGPVVHAVRGFGLEMRRGERVGVVGESGSGKSVGALAIAQLMEPPAVVLAERLELFGADLTTGRGAAARALRARLGSSLGLVFQDPFGSFNPLMRVGGQLEESAVRNGNLTRRAARRRAVERLGAVRLPDPQRVSRQFPHQLSGGMLQRGMIAMGLMNKPELIIADEPTTALDVTVQQEVLRLVRSVCDDTGAGLLFISHDLAVVLEVCERVVVMYAGRVVEDLSADDIRAGRVHHPYTRGLLGSVIDLTTNRDAPLTAIPGRPPVVTGEIDGCAFAPRCPRASEQCTTEPEVQLVGPRHRVACWHAAPVPVAPAPPAGAELVHE